MRKCPGFRSTKKNSSLITSATAVKLPEAAQCGGVIFGCNIHLNPGCAELTYLKTFEDNILNSINYSHIWPSSMLRSRELESFLHYSSFNVNFNSMRISIPQNFFSNFKHRISNFRDVKRNCGNVLLTLLRLSPSPKRLKLILNFTRYNILRLYINSGCF